MIADFGLRIADWQGRLKMMSQRRIIFNRRDKFVTRREINMKNFIFALVLLTAVGCKQPLGQNKTTRAEQINQQLVAAPVPSVEKIQPRPWPERVVEYAPVGIGHPMLYLRDPFEYEGPWAGVSDDGYFRTVAAEDYLVVAANPFIFLGELVATPFYMVARPPWQYECSRGGFPVQEPTYFIPGESSGMTRNDPAGIDYRGCCSK